MAGALLGALYSSRLSTDCSLRKHTLLYAFNIRKWILGKFSVRLSKAEPKFK